VLLGPKIKMAAEVLPRCELVRIPKKRIAQRGAASKRKIWRRGHAQVAVN
jgi:hypothetical protein